MSDETMAVGEAAGTGAAACIREVLTNSPDCESKDIVAAHQHCRERGGEEGQVKGGAVVSAASASHVLREAETHPNRRAWMMCQ